MGFHTPRLTVVFEYLLGSYLQCITKSNPTKIVKPNITEYTSMSESKRIADNESEKLAREASIKEQEEKEKNRQEAKEKNNNNNNSNSSSSNTKTDATIELANKSKAKVEVMIQSARGGSKTNFSINAGSTERKRIKVGESVYVNGSLAFTVTADMDKSKQIIAK